MFLDRFHADPTGRASDISWTFAQACLSSVRVSVACLFEVLARLPFAGSKRSISGFVGGTYRDLNWTGLDCDAMAGSDDVPRNTFGERDGSLTRNALERVFSSF